MVFFVLLFIVINAIAIRAVLVARREDEKTIIHEDFPYSFGDVENVEFVPSDKVPPGEVWFVDKDSGKMVGKVVNIADKRKKK